MCLSGKNICINKNGIISLIDFDIAIINNYKSKKIKQIYKSHYPENYYIIFKKEMMNIISNIL